MQDFITAWKGLAALATLLFGVPPQQAPGSLLNGPPVPVEVGAPLCVPREFVDPFALKQAVVSGKPISGPYERVHFSMFTPELTGFTAAHYAAGLDKAGDKTRYPSDWVQVIVRKNNFSNPSTTSSIIRQQFESESTVDSGFRSHRAQRNCVGQVVGTGYFQVQLKADCLEQELKYDHAVDRSVVLHCSPARCSVVGALEWQGVWHQYSFPRDYLSEWPKLHSRIKIRLSEWKNLQACGH